MPEGPTPVTPLISLMRGSRPANIVHLDDCEEVRGAFKALLGFWFTDFQLCERSNGDEIIDVVACHPTDLLITDYTHPGLRGEEFFHYLAAQQVTFPILLCSAYVGGVPGLKTRLASIPGLKLQFLDKPFSGSDFKTFIRSLLT